MYFTSVNSCALGCACNALVATMNPTNFGSHFMKHDHNVCSDVELNMDTQ